MRGEGGITTCVNGVEGNVMREVPKIKIWVTMYALTNGIQEYQAEMQEDGTVMVRDPGYLSTYFHKGQWHKTREAAVERAEEMRRKRIASLKQQIDRLERMEF